MKNFEIGIDIQKISEFEDVSEGFLKKIFTENEISYCSGKSKPAQHFAARFAVKEAIIKALSQFEEKVNYKDIETLINNKKLQTNILKKLGLEYDFKVSLSHSGEYALGFVVVSYDE